jgi:hypothetical protein
MQKHSHCSASSDPLPPRFLTRLEGFVDLFTRPTWANVLLLLAGVILAPCRRTVTAALRILGRDRDHNFCTFHRILNRAAWSSRATAGRLLLLLVNTFVPPGAPIVIGLDDTIERRWGAKISARGIYRDPVRSSKGHVVKASGLRWLSAMLLVQVPWADRIMALPFLTPCPLQAVLCQQTPSPQDTSRLGQASRSATPPLASQSIHHAGRR